jgi:hypothetical protein
VLLQDGCDWTEETEGKSGLRECAHLSDLSVEAKGANWDNRSLRVVVFGNKHNKQQCALLVTAGIFETLDRRLQKKHFIRFVAAHETSISMAG